MKKIIINLIIVFSCICSVAAKDRLEIWGGYSLGSAIGNVPEVSAPYLKSLGTNMELYNHRRHHEALSLGFNVRIIKNLSIGLSWTGLNSYSFDFRLYNSKPEVPVVSSKYNTNTVLFNLKYQWAKFSIFRLYSRGGIGAVFISAPKRSGDILYQNYSEDFTWNDGNDAVKRFAWQISPIGVEIRPLPFIGVFAEGGFGRQGNLVAGIKFFCL